MNPEQPYQQPGQFPGQPPVPPGSLPNGPYQQVPPQSGQAAYQPPVYSGQPTPGPYPTAQPAPYQQPYAQPQVTPSSDPYAFITNPAALPKQKLFSLGALNPLKLLALLGGAAIIIILLVVVASAIFGGNSAAETELVAIAAKQQEIARVADNGQDANSADVKNASIAIHLTMISDQNTLVNYLKKHNVKVTDKQLAAAQDSKIDDTLTAAKANSTFDSTLSSALRDDLTSYASSLQTAYKQSESSTTKQLLKTEYDHAQLLLEQQRP